MHLSLVIAAVTAAIGGMGSSASTESTIPNAVIQDPSSDPAHLPRMILAPMPTHGIHIPALFYTAADTGKRPTLILLTGMPGAETNSDLIYAVRRAGWNVLVFHYRGSWGSSGNFSIRHCIEDAAAAVAWLRAPSPEIAPFVDSRMIVIAGHSFGGWLAGLVAADDPQISAAALISAADMAIDPDTPRSMIQHSLDAWVHVEDMRLLNTTTDDLATEALRDGAGWDLTKKAAALARHPLLVITANDGLAPYDDEIARAVRTTAGSNVTEVHFNTNHGYNDRRIALAGSLVSWLQKLGNP